MSKEMRVGVTGGGGQARFTVDVISGGNRVRAVLKSPVSDIMIGEINQKIYDKFPDVAAAWNEWVKTTFRRMIKEAVAATCDDYDVVVGEVEVEGGEADHDTETVNDEAVVGGERPGEEGGGVVFPPGPAGPDVPR